MCVCFKENSLIINARYFLPILPLCIQRLVCSKYTLHNWLAEGTHLTGDCGLKHARLDTENPHFLCAGPRD